MEDEEIIVQLKSIQTSPVDVGWPSTRKTTKPINIDEILTKEVGPIGLWQWSLVVLGILSTTACSTFPVFSDTEPLKRCYLGKEYESQLEIKGWDFFQIGLVTGGWTETENPESPSSGCHVYKNWQDRVNASLANQTIPHPSNDSIPCGSMGYVYDFMWFQYRGGIVVDFNLVCDQVWLVPIGTSVFMVGMMLGYILGGFWGARFGIKHALICFSALELISSCACSAAHEFWLYTCLRMLVAIGAYGKLSSFNLVILDITIPRYRAIVNAVYLLGFNFTSRALLALFAMGLSDWRWLNAAATSHCVLVFTYYFVVPESPRWLLARKETVKAIKVLEFGQWVNACFGRREKKDGDSQTLDQLTEEEKRRPSIVSVHRINFDEKKHRFVTEAPKSTQKLFTELFSSWYMIKTNILSTSIFFLFAFVFIGLLLYTRMIRETVYTISLIIGAVAVPGVFLAIFAYRIVKQRRLPLCLTYVLVALVLCAGGVYTFVAQPEEDTVLSVTVIFSLMIFVTLQCMMFIYIPELYPSHLRAQGFGMSAGFGRLGSAISTFVNHLDSTYKHGMPIILYSVAAILCAALTMGLSDTTGAEEHNASVKTEVNDDDDDGFEDGDEVVYC